MDQPVIEHRRFGKYLRRIREERRLSLDAVEEMSVGLIERVTKSHLSRIENGQAVPSFPRMFTLSQIYGVPVSDLAERFELCLRMGMRPAEVVDHPVDKVLARAKSLRVAGRHAEALGLYEGLLDHADGSLIKDSLLDVDVRLERINCMVKLSREASAKEACESLLGAELTTRQRVITLQYLAICSYRMGRFMVARMAIKRAEEDLEDLDDAETLTAHLAVLKGNVSFIQGRFKDAVEAFADGLRRFQLIGNGFEACRVRLNLASALMESGPTSRPRAILHEALEVAEAAGYDRQRAYALSHLGKLAYKEGDQDAAESFCLRSNRLARPRDYVAILFRNCFYLWEISRSRDDNAARKANERTLRKYLNRVEEYLPEVEQFRNVAGGKEAS